MEITSPPISRVTLAPFDLAEIEVIAFRINSNRNSYSFLFEKKSLFLLDTMIVYQQINYV